MPDSVYTDQSNYGYTPSLAWSVVFIVLFGVSACECPSPSSGPPLAPLALPPSLTPTIPFGVAPGLALTAVLHSYQAYRAKYWVVYPTLVLGCITEILGWSARLWSNRNVLLLTPFLMQISTLIMAPVFFSAFDYIILGVAIRRLGPQYSLLRPGWYLSIFLTADVVSLILQAVGGGQASASAGDGAPTQTATDIMVAGIIFQLVSMGIFVVLGFDFILRATSKRAYAFRERQIAAKRAKAAEKAQEKGGSQATLTHVASDETVVPDSTGTKVESTAAEEQVEARENLSRWWIMLAGCLISSIAIVTRGIYRSIELSAGWESEIIQTEILQAILDGLMMVIAVGIFNILNPLYLLPKRATWKGFH